MADAPHFVFRTGRFGRSDGAAGLSVRELRVFSLASVIARQGQADAASAAAALGFGTRLPARPSIGIGPEFAFVWSGPGQWLALAASADADVEARVGSSLGELVSIVDQGGSRIMLELAGPRVRDTLAKTIELDLHPHAFRTGDAAVTTSAHIGVHLWQVADDPVYRLLVVRTWFDSFWQALAASAAEYGCEVLPARPYG